MMTPIWILKSVILSLAEQLAVYGEKYEIRDTELLEHILTRLSTLFHKNQMDIFELAASYASEMIKNHPFIQGNGRISLVIVLLFLTLNGYNIIATRGEKAIVFLLFSNTLLSEKQLTVWLRAKSRKIAH